MKNPTNQVTRAVSNRIAVVFDFDETLTPHDSFAVLLQACQLDADEFTRNRIQPLLDQGWEKYLARAYCLVQESQQRSNQITQDKLASVGQQIELYEGVNDLFAHLQQKIQAISEDTELEFYLISGGFVDIPRNTSVAKDFVRMWGCELHYDETGAVAFMKRQMTHTEKTRYLYYLSKGIEQSDNEKDLIYNYPNLPADELHVPLNQVIYVGDGASDIPCFDVIRQHGGTAIGIYAEGRSAEQWEYLEEIKSSQRLSNLVPASYEKDSELVQSLSLSVESLAKKLALHQLSSKH
ncbi:MAG: haloacid dehalogenase-like hydrolase [Cyanobacteria bacterium P01_A01_bin.114]